MKRHQLLCVLIPPLLASVVGCTQHKIETKSEVEIKPIKVEPIHITIDVNVRVQEKLKDFFAFEDELNDAQ